MISLTAGSGSLWLTSESPLSSPVTNLFRLLEHCFLLQRSTLCVTRVTHWFSSILYRYKIQNSFPSEIIIIWLKATMQTLFLTGQEWSLHYAFEPELPSKNHAYQDTQDIVFIIKNNICETPQTIQAMNIWKATTYLNSDFTVVLWVLPSTQWWTYK